MKYCEQCKVSVTGQRSRCPLCQSVLRDEGEPYEEVFPVIPTVYNRFQFFFKLLIFASAVLGIVSAVINLLLPQSGVWSLFVLGGIGCLWVFLFIAVRKRNNIPKNILWQVAVTILFCLLWDLFTGWHGWSVDYVVQMCIRDRVNTKFLLKTSEIKEKEEAKPVVLATENTQKKGLWERIKGIFVK